MHVSYMALILVVTGMGVIQRMGMVAVDGEDRPKNPILIHRATSHRGPPSDAPLASTLQNTSLHPQITST